jgi:transcriptional regulator with XRE-family HTH domain
MNADAPPFHTLLRSRRAHQGLTQMALALQADVSTRHLSWLETGKAQPSRAMVLRLAEQLDLPLRERNAWLTSAGFAPMYRETALTDPALAPARAVLQQLLDAHEPALALAVDRHWNLVAANRMLPLFLQGVAPALLVPPVNLLRLALHPDGLAASIDNINGWRAHVLTRLQRQAQAQMQASGDETLLRLLAELQALAPASKAPSSPGGAMPTSADPADEIAATDVAVPLRLNSAHGRLNFITTITVFGAPNDITLAEIAIETLLPADPTTAATLRRLRATLAEGNVELVPRGAR